MREVRAGIYTGRYHVSMLKLTNEVGQIGLRISISEDGKGEFQKIVN